jgi:hypothetical protein
MATVTFTFVSGFAWQAMKKHVAFQVWLAWIHPVWIAGCLFCKLGIHCRVHGSQDDLILSAKLIRIAPENSSF